MAITVDQDQQWLLNCLTATLDTNHEVRSFVEASFTPSVLAARFWIGVDESCCEQGGSVWIATASDMISWLLQFQAVIRELLLLSLDDPHAKMCTAIGMAVASIAQNDWPENWPELLPVLLKMISCQTNMSGVRGAVKCLALLSDDLDDNSVPGLIPVLFPCLYTIISTPEILALLADMLIEIREQGVGEDEDSDWEETQDGDGDANQEFLHSGGALSHGNPTTEHLDAIAKAFCENQDDSFEDDHLGKADPLRSIWQIIFLVKFYGIDRILFNHLCQNLTPTQQSAIQTGLHP